MRRTSILLGWRGYLWLLAIYTASQAIRTWRFQLGLPVASRPSFLKMGAITSLHQFSNHLMPVRLGELAFPYLLQRWCQIPPDRSLALLLRVRLQEVSVLGTLFMVALCLLGASPHSPGRGLNWAVLAAVATATISAPVLLERSLPLILVGAERLLALLRPRDESSRLHRWSTRAGNLTARIGRESRQPIPLVQRWATLGLTLLVWLLIFLLFHEAMRLSGHPVSAAATIVGSSFGNLAQLLPINTWGSIGSMELGWTLGFSLVGVPAEHAMATAIVIHLLVLSFLALFCLPSWLWLQMSPLGGQPHRPLPPKDHPVDART